MLEKIQINWRNTYLLDSKFLAYRHVYLMKFFLTGLRNDIILALKTKTKHSLSCSHRELIKASPFGYVIQFSFFSNRHWTHGHKFNLEFLCSEYTQYGYIYIYIYVHMLMCQDWLKKCSDSFKRTMCCFL